MTTREFKRFQRFLNFDGRLCGCHGWMILYFPEAEHDYERFVILTEHRKDVRDILQGEYIKGYHYKQVRRINLWISTGRAQAIYF